MMKDNCDKFECKICLEIDKIENFISPCDCKGSIKHIHMICLKNSIKYSKDSSKCDLCNYKYNYIKKFDMYDFMKILNYFNLFILNNYIPIILCLIYFTNYVIILPIYLSISFFMNFTRPN